MKDETVGAVGFVVLLMLFALIVASLGWVMTHPVYKDIVTCQKAGYTTAYQPLFSNDVFCTKSISTPIQDAEKESK